MQYHKYRLTELENMMPWERDIYLTLLKNYIEERKSKETTKQKILMDEEALEKPKKITATISLNQSYRFKDVSGRAFKNLKKILHQLKLMMI